MLVMIMTWQLSVFDQVKKEKQEFTVKMREGDSFLMPQVILSGWYGCGWYGWYGYKYGWSKWSKMIRIHIMGPCDSFLISQVSDEDRVSDDDDKTDHLESSLGAAQISCQPKSGVSWPPLPLLSNCNGQHLAYPRQLSSGFARRPFCTTFT